MTLNDLPSLKDSIKQHDLWPDKKYGQNFLLDQNITDKIARQAGPLDGHTVIEVGPGPGGLTRSLLNAGAKKVYAIEYDKRCQPILSELAEAAQGRLDVIYADAVETELAQLGDEPRKIVANLPYNVATPLLIGWLKEIHAYKSLTLMFQKEVADRIKAMPRTSEYGRLSIIAQKLCHVGHLFDLRPDVFFPPPKVRSSVIQLTPKPIAYRPDQFSALQTVTREAFGQRRKMLRSSLSGLGIPDLGPRLDALGIPITARAEELSIDDFSHLAEMYLDYLKKA